MGNQFFDNYSDKKNKIATVKSTQHDELSKTYENWC